MSDSLTHPSALAMSRTKPARQSRMMEKQKIMGRNRYIGGKKFFKKMLSYLTDIFQIITSILI